MYKNKVDRSKSVHFVFVLPQNYNNKLFYYKNITTILQKHYKCKTYTKSIEKNILIVYYRNMLRVRRKYSQKF